MQKTLFILILLFGAVHLPVWAEDDASAAGQEIGQLFERMDELNTELANTTAGGRRGELAREIRRIQTEITELLDWLDDEEEGFASERLKVGVEFPELAFVGNAKAWLLARIETLKVQLHGTVRQSRRDEIFLEIGDAYHWLGHIAEQDEDDVEAAHNYFDDAIRFYRESNIRRSERINDLDTMEHAIYHLEKISRQVRSEGQGLMEFASAHFEQSATNRATRGVSTTHFPTTFASRCIRAIQEYISTSGD